MMRITGSMVFAWAAAGLVVFPGTGRGQARVEGSSPRQAQTPAQVIGAGYATPRSIDVAPGQIITIFTRVPGKVAADPVTATPPLPTTLAGFSVVLRQTFSSNPQAVPIASAVDFQSCSMVAPAVCDTVSMITVEVPFELTPNAPPGSGPTVTGPQNFARLEIGYNGSQTSSLFLNPIPVRVHVLNSCDVAANVSAPAACLPMVTRPDGSLVAAGNAPQAGEVLTVWAVGLGIAQTPVATGAPAPQAGATVDGVLVGLDTRANASPGMPAAASSSPAKSAQLQGGMVGIYQITFTVPSLPAGTPVCGVTVQSNLTVNIARAASYDGVGICVNPQ